MDARASILAKVEMDIVNLARGGITMLGGIFRKKSKWCLI
jgi:hypothetical protein